MANSMMTGSKVRSDKKAAFKNERQCHMSAKERAECHAKPSWKHQMKRSKEK